MRSAAVQVSLLQFARYEHARDEHTVGMTVANKRSSSGSGVEFPRYPFHGGCRPWPVGRRVIVALRGEVSCALRGFFVADKVFRSDVSLYLDRAWPNRAVVMR